MLSYTGICWHTGHFLPDLKTQQKQCQVFHVSGFPGFDPFRILNKSDNNNNNYYYYYYYYYYHYYYYYIISVEIVTSIMSDSTKN